MKRDELLTELAMELESWPDFQEGQAPPPNAPGIWGTHYGTWECFAKGNTNPILYGHWLQRRTELINCPPDSEAPSEEARYKSQDANGEWWWHALKPFQVAGPDVWDSDGWQSLAHKGAVPASHDWRTTLAEVNQGACTAEEDAAWAEKDVQLNGAKGESAREEWRGPEDGLPPIDTVCEWSDCGRPHKRALVMGYYADSAWLRVFNSESDGDWFPITVRCKPSAFRPLRAPEQRAEDDAVNEMAEAALSGDPFTDAESDALTYCSRIYAAIKAGRIPGVVLGGGHE